MVDTNDWNELWPKYRVYANISLSDDKVKFTKAMGEKKDNTLSIPVDELLQKKNETEIYKYLFELTDGNNDVIPKVQGPANRIWNLKHVVHIPVIQINYKEPEEVAQIFERFNTAGTRLKATDVKLAVIAAKNIGWVTNNFLPFTDSLEEKSFDLPSGYLLQTLTVANQGKARMSEVDAEYWDEQVINDWTKTSSKIEEVVDHLWDEGIISLDLIPSEYTLIPLFSIHTRCSERHGYSFARSFSWFLRATLEGRYSGAPLENLSRDAAVIYNSKTFDEAMSGLTSDTPLPTKSDLIETFKGPFKRGSAPALLLHLALMKNDSKDWLTNLSIKGQFHSKSKSSSVFKSHWHHTLPKSWAKTNKYENANATANITILTESTNVRKLRSLPPWEYVPKFNISDVTLKQHFIPEFFASKFTKGQALTKKEFLVLLDARSEALASSVLPLLGD